MRNGRVYCLSTVDLDRVFHVERFPGPDEKVFATRYSEGAGGQGVFVARALVGLRVPVTFVGVVGDDATGVAVVNELRRYPDLAVDVETVPGRHTGSCVILVDPSGEKSIVLTPLQTELVAGLGHALHVTPMDIVTANFYHASAPRLLFDRVRAEGGLSLLDLEITAVDLFGWDNATLVAAAADFVCTNAPTMRAWCRSQNLDLTPLDGAKRFAEHLGQPGRGVCVTLGAGGVWVNDGKTAHHYPATPVRAVNTTGAGDTFLAGLTKSLREGRELHHAAKLAQGVVAHFLTHGSVTPE